MRCKLYQRDNRNCSLGKHLSSRKGIYYGMLSAIRYLAKRTSQLPKTAPSSVVFVTDFSLAVHCRTFLPTNRPDRDFLLSLRIQFAFYQNFITPPIVKAPIASMTHTSAGSRSPTMQTWASFTCSAYNFADPGSVSACCRVRWYVITASLQILRAKTWLLVADNVNNTYNY